MLEILGNFLGKVRRGMPDRTAIRNAVGAELALSEDMSSAISLWRDMYETDEGLHLASAIASELARMVTIELPSEISGSRRAEYLQKVYSKLIGNIRVPVEYGCAMGGIVFKPFVSNGGLELDIVQADSFFPTAFDNSGRITGAVFAQRITVGDSYYTRLEYHKLENGGYTVRNRVFRSRSKDSLGCAAELSEVEQWASLAEEMTIGNVRQPLFGYFKPAIANTVDLSSPLGVSVFANAANLIEDADKQYARLLWEFESGERALIANSMAFKRDRSGRLQLPDKRLYRTLDVEDMDFFREWSPTIREQSILHGLDRIYRQIEFSCGLAYGTLSDVQNSEKTAEEIRVSNQRSYTTVSDNQKALKNALCDAVYAMDVWCTLYNLAPVGSYSISFDFDDSIAADRKTEFEEKRTMVENGIMMPWEFRMWYFGEDEETSRRVIAENEKARAENNAPKTL